MKINVMPNLTKDVPDKERIMEMIRGGIYTLCFTGIIMHLIEYDNYYYQDARNVQSGIAMIFFTLLLFTVQKVKLFNIPSLIVTAVYSLIAFFGIRMFAFAPVLLPTRILYAVANWLAIMIVTDMVVTKRIRKLKQMNLWLFGILGLAVILMEVMKPATYSYPYLYLFLLCLIPISEKEWSVVLGGLLNAGLLSFISVAILSHAINPYISGEEIVVKSNASSRWRGYFTNFPKFGEYCSLSVALAFTSLIRSKDRYGRFGIYYLFSLIWMAISIVYVMLNGKTDCLFGAVFMLLILFVFGFRKTKHPWLLLRGCVALSAVFLIGYFLIGLIDVVTKVGYDPKNINQVIQNTPLRFFPSGANFFFGKVINFSASNVANAFKDKPVLAFINNIGSHRLEIIGAFAEHIAFYAGTEGEFYAGGRYFGSAHNQYVQQLYEYGFLAGGMGLLVYLAGFVTAIVRYVKEKKEIYFIPMAVLAMAFGVWIGESEGIFYPLAFAGFISLIPCFMGKRKNND